MVELGIDPATPLEPLPALLADRSRPFADRAALPPVSVVLSTRERPDSLRRALLSLARIDDPTLDIVVVDNAAKTSATYDVVVGEFGHDPRFRYVAEPTPGLSHGRNCGLTNAIHDIVAYTDDDVEVDPLWIRVLAATFADSPDARLRHRPRPDRRDRHAVAAGTSTAG